MCGLQCKSSERVDMSVMRWYEHMGRMSAERLVKHIYREVVGETREIGKPRARRHGSVRKVLSEREMPFQQSERCVQDGEIWRSICKTNDEQPVEAQMDRPLSVLINILK